MSALSLSCGSLRPHGRHQWIGRKNEWISQRADELEVYDCPGAAERNGLRGLPSERDLEEMDLHRCMADQEEVGSL